MSQKIYYNATNNKAATDVSGVKDEAIVIAEAGLGAGTQVLEIDDSFEDTEVIGGTLTKFDAKQRGLDQVAAAQADHDTKQTASLAKLNAGRTGPDLTIQDLEDLGI